MTAMNKERRRVLVTGGAGFIGSELVRQLSAMSAEVIVVDNLVNGRRENLEGFLTKQIQLVQADVRDIKCMTDLLKNVDVVFHLACLGVRHSIHSPLESHEVNATATLQLLELAKSAAIPRFVYVSTSEVYGTARWVPMTEEHPTYPNTVYGASKLAGECYARAYHETYGYSTVVVRPFNTYGPRCHHEGDSGEVIPKFLLRCLAGRPMVIFGDGTQTRDFTYVEDTARGILSCGMTDAAVGQTINLGSSEEIAISDLAHKVASLVGRPDDAVIHEISRPGDVLRLYANANKARQLVGFKPRVSLLEGMAKLRDWYLAQNKSPEKLLEDEIVRNWERQEEGASGHD
jgi:UDP-glucose 4-epimerase